MQEKEFRNIEGMPSVFLDCVRFAAAMIVFYVHSKEIWFPSTVHVSGTPGDITHAAVMVFFVLSGYVIFYTTIGKKRGGIQYASSRLSRLYSVMLPAILLSVISQITITQINPSVYEDFSLFNSVGRYILSTFFLNEIFTLSAAPIVNGPLWTIGYEFIFYLIFGLWYYKCHTIKSKLSVVILSIIIAPKVILLFPVWLLGGAAYLIKTPQIKSYLSYFIVLLCLFCACLFCAVSPSLPFTLDTKLWGFSGQFITDYIFGFLIALSFYFLPNGKKPEHPVWVKAVNFSRNIGNLTFPIYAFHFPLLLLFKNIVPFTQNRSQQHLTAFFTILVISVISGYFCNRSKDFWLRIFQKIFHKINFFHNSK